MNEQIPYDTCGVALGQEFGGQKACIKAIVQANGLLCTFKPITGGRTFNKVLNVTPEEYSCWLEGTRIQDAMVNLSAVDRELFLSGMSW